jgi:hypothetical protein
VPFRLVIGIAPEYKCDPTREAMTCEPMSMAAGGRTELLAKPTRRRKRCPSMRAYVSRLVLLMMLVGSMLILGAGSVAAHCVQTSAGLVDLSPGHFASAHGHTTAIASSGKLLELGECVGPFVNDPAPSNNPPPGTPR